MLELPSLDPLRFSDVLGIFAPVQALCHLPVAGMFWVQLPGRSWNEIGWPGSQNQAAFPGSHFRSQNLFTNGGFQKWGTPQNGWFTMEPPI